MMAFISQRRKSSQICAENERKRQTEREREKGESLHNNKQSLPNRTKPSLLTILDSTNETVIKSLS